jgi:hypothetical protein
MNGESLSCIPVFLKLISDVIEKNVKKEECNWIERKKKIYRFTK